jgi:hypothetical protein
MRLFSASALAAMIVLLLNGRYLLAVVAYLAGGAVWTYVDLRRPFTQRPVTVFQPSFVYVSMIFWPLRLLVDLSDTVQLVRRAERYLVLTAPAASFRTWREAQAHAKHATADDSPVMITDQVRLTWRHGQLVNKYWFVERE